MNSADILRTNIVSVSILLKIIIVCNTINLYNSNVRIINIYLREFDMVYFIQSCSFCAPGRFQVAAAVLRVGC